MLEAATSQRKLDLDLFSRKYDELIHLRFSRDERRETVGIFLCKPIYRQAENQYLMVPPEKAKRLSPQAQRLLGYGICRPALGFIEYQDPMRVLFGVEDEETVDM